MGNELYYLPENIKHLRKIKGASQERMAEELAVPRSTLNNWERGTAAPSFTILKRYAELFNLSIDDLIQLELSAFSKLPERNEGIKVLTVVEEQAPGGIIELVEMKAEAGYVENFNDPTYIKDLPKISFPNIPKGHYRGFEISGDSMLPIESGSIVICSYVENISDVVDGKTYVVATRDGLVYKRLYKDPQKYAFTMISDNTEYMPYIVEFEEISEIWQFYAYLSFSDGKQILKSMGEERFDMMSKKVDSLHRGLIDPK